MRPDDNVTPLELKPSAGQVGWRRPSLRSVVVLNRLLLVAALLPFFHLALGALCLLPSVRLRLTPLAVDLTARPIAYAIAQTGYWSLVMLVASLAITPLRRLLRWNELIRLRRMLGLVAFFYAALHVLVWGALDKFFDAAWMVEDIVKRPFITVGTLSFVLLLPLAITSNRAAISRLGRRWQTLHQLVYVAALGSVVHYWMWRNVMVADPERFAIILALLLALRGARFLRTGRASARAHRPTPICR